MKKKFDLYQELANKGFTEKENTLGTMLVKSYEKEVEVAWYGKMKTPYRVEVLFNADQTVANVCYFKEVAPHPVKVKAHLNEKRAFNAICETIKNAGFEM